VTLLVVALLCLLAEGSARLLFPEINFLDTDSRLFVQNAYGPTHGNAPNFTGVSFGTVVSTGADGFRFNQSLTMAGGAGDNRPTVLFLGDSITFGVGVPDGVTFVDALARRLPQWRFINAGSIGYDTNDYEEFVERFAIPNKGRLRISKIVLGFCLNDLSARSRANIADHRNSPDAANSAGAGGQPNDAVAATAGETPRYQGIAGWLHKHTGWLNEWLRSRSKLFLVLKNLMVDSSKAYFLADLSLYRDEATVLGSVSRVHRISQELSAAGIDFAIAIFPYEYQLRAQQPDLFLPQRTLLERLRQRGIKTVDLARPFLDDMQRSRRASRDYFLFNDPMHLSVLGHQVAAHGIEDIVPAER
jgi:lysophospholipase L1-like esterase